MLRAALASLLALASVWVGPVAQPIDVYNDTSYGFLTLCGHFVAPQSASVDTFDSAPRLDSRSAAIGRV